VSSAQVIADLEAALEAARADVAGAPATDTSGLPGGVDSAPVNKPDGMPSVPPVVTASPLANAETEIVDIIGELKGGASVSDVANRLLDQSGLASIVKAIGELAGKVL
jgi:hypothetical protein